MVSVRGSQSLDLAGLQLRDGKVSVKSQSVQWEFYLFRVYPSSFGQNAKLENGGHEYRSNG